jgi:hypothetical protein
MPMLLKCLSYVPLRGYDYSAHSAAESFAQGPALPKGGRSPFHLRQEQTATVSLRRNGRLSHGQRGHDSEEPSRFHMVSGSP